MVENGCEYLYWRKPALKSHFSAFKTDSLQTLENIFSMIAQLSRSSLF